MGCILFHCQQHAFYLIISPESIFFPCYFNWKVRLHVGLEICKQAIYWGKTIALSLRLNLQSLIQSSLWYWSVTWAIWINWMKIPNGALAEREQKLHFFIQSITSWLPWLRRRSLVYFQELVADGSLQAELWAYDNWDTVGMQMWHRNCKRIL